MAAGSSLYKRHVLKHFTFNVTSFKKKLTERGRICTKHLQVLDRNLKKSKDLKKLEQFDSQVFQILPELELEYLNSSTFET